MNQLKFLFRFLQLNVSKSFSVIFALLIVLFSDAYSANPKIKSLQVYSNENQTEFPIVSIGDNASGSLTIEFDVESQFNSDLSIYFRLCDKDWNPINNPFLLNRGNERVDFLILERLPSLITGAQYHYKETFPNEKVTFPFSGKWKFFVVDVYDESKIFASGGFIVIEKLLDINIKVDSEIRSDKNYFPTDLAKSLIINSSFSIPIELYPQNLIGVEIIENNKLYSSYFVDKNIKNSNSEFYWNGNRDFNFIAKGIIPGNEYRQANLNQYTSYSLKEVYAYRDRIETSRFFKFGGRDNNGATVLSDYKDINSDYLNVKFSIRPPQPFSNDIYLVGSFNQWKIYDEFLLDDDDGLYTISIPLKRGVYDYQYVVKSGNSFDWNILEGNFLETSNRYHVLVYNNDTTFGGYQKIIGYSTIILNSNNGKK